MNKILVLGPSGAGKSTFSNRLGKKLNIKVCHLDTIYWEKGWVIRSKEAYLNDLNNILHQDQYILDGNHSYGDSLKLRISQADTIIYFQFNRFKCLFGAIKRYFMYKNKTRPSMTEGCHEKLDIEFIKWILWDYPRRKRKKINKLIKENFKGELFKFKNRKQLNLFLKKLGDAIE